MRPSSAADTAHPPSSAAAPKPRLSALPALLLLAATALALTLLAPSPAMPLTDRVKAAFAPSRAAPPAAAELPPAAARRLNALGLALFARVAGGDAAADVALSPASVAAALAMALEGATPGSHAERELRDAVGGTAGAAAVQPKDGVEWVVANAAWTTAAVHEAYKKSVRALGAQVEPMPSGAGPVNEWVRARTGGRISQIITAIPPNVVALLVNAVYFKARWEVAFEEARTAERPWYADGGEGREVKKVRMMRMSKKKLLYVEVVVGDDGAAQLVELPYAGGEFSAVAVVPSGRTTVGDVVRHVGDGGADAWDAWMGRAQRQTLDEVGMPRFRVGGSASSLKAALQGVGVRAAFVEDEQRPPFARMTADKGTFVHDVLHAATVECTEQGTVATAASAVVLMSRSMPRKHPEVWMDRPFVLAVRARGSGALLFLARVDDPVSP